MLLVGYPGHACRYSILFLMLVISKTKCADIVDVVRSVGCASDVMFVSGSVHNFVFGSRVPVYITLSCLVTDTSVAVNVTMHSSSHNFPMKMSECLARPGNMYPFCAVFVRPMTVKAHCVFVDSMEPSGRATLMCHFASTVLTGAEG